MLPITLPAVPVTAACGTNNQHTNCAGQRQMVQVRSAANSSHVSMSKSMPTDAMFGAAAPV
eukprot:6204761-Pleurochrysis_carterae.AAC.3